MLILIGGVIVFLSAMGGFMIAGGNPVVLLHVSEFVCILGIAAGVLVIHDVFPDPADGGRPPYELYLRALDADYTPETERLIRRYLERLR